MKNIIIEIKATVLLCLIAHNLFGQATSGNVGNVRTAGDYIGWVNGTNAPLDIKNEDAEPIKFYTNSGAGAYNNLRMIIAAAGNVGINITAPQNLMHVDGGSNAAYSQFTNTTTGSGSGTTGFQVGVDANGNAELKSNYSAGTNGAMNFYTGGTQRAVITNAGKVGVNTNAPATDLHLNSTATVVQRFSVNNSTTKYLEISEDQNGVASFDARPLGGTMMFMLNGTQRGRLWGNSYFWSIGSSNFTTAIPTGPQSMFTLNENSTSQEVWAQWTNLAVTGTLATDGIRMGMTTNGTAEIRQNENLPLNFYTNYGSSTTGSLTIGGNKYTGVGDFVSTVTAPARRLEVYESGSDPQLRITHTLASKYVDFQTLSTGDLYIHPVSSGATRRVGVNAASPQYGLHNEGSALFTNTSVTGALTMTSQTHPLIANSSSDEAFTVLHQGTGSRDNLRLFGDANGMYHYRMMGSGADMSFDNNATNNESWLGYSASNTQTVFKSDFNTTPVPQDYPTNFFSLYYHPDQSKVFMDAQSAETNNPMRVSLFVNNTNPDVNAGPFTSIVGYIATARATDGGTIPINRGGHFLATGASGATSGIGYNYAVHGETRGVGDFSYNAAGRFTTTQAGNNNFGIYCSSTDGVSTNYGIYSYSPSGTCGTGSCAQAAAFFSGDVYTSSSSYYTSDATLKTNILPLNNADSLLRNVNVYSYNYLTQNPFRLTLPEGNHYGVLSQELETIMPNLVRTFKQPEEKDDGGNIIQQAKDVKAVNYVEFIPLLIAAYQKQEERIDSLVQVIDNLSPLRTGNNTPVNLSVELQNAKAIVLNQNEPNPFAEQTTITWNIPADANGGELNAMLIFYDNAGTVLNSVKIKEAGQGSLLVYGSKLSQGVYTYSLVVNNKTVESKRMVKAR